jgi:hypothetical protein
MASLADSLSQYEYEALERELECTDPWVLLELDVRKTAFATTVASALTWQLSRCQVLGSFPPVFADSAFALAMAKQMATSEVLTRALPQYFRDALAELLPPHVDQA